MLADSAGTTSGVVSGLQNKSDSNKLLQFITATFWSGIITAQAHRLKQNKLIINSYSF